MASKFFPSGGGIRRDPSYLSHEVYRALWVLARARTSKSKDHITTADEMADLLLRQVISEKYPQLFEHQKKIDELEKKLIGTIPDEDSDSQ